MADSKWVNGGVTPFGGLTVETCIVSVEIVAKQKGCMLCDLAIAMLEEIAPDFQPGALSWDVVDVGSREGVSRHEHLRGLCGRRPLVPSIVINERIAFDHIPDMEALRHAVRQALAK